MITEEDIKTANPSCIPDSVKDVLNKPESERSEVETAALNLWYDAASKFTVQSIKDARKNRKVSPE